MMMTDVVIEQTKNDIIAEIEAIDVAIGEAKDTQPEVVIPEHDLYRGVMFGECIPCGYRYVDPEGCATCQPGMDFLQQFRAVYPWKSDQKVTREERAKMPKKVQ
jgi:hypothetical protein